MFTIHRAWPGYSTLLLGCFALALAACGPREAEIETPVQPTEPPPPESTFTAVPPPSATPSAPAHPAAGLTFSTAEGLWLVDGQGDIDLLVDSSQARLSPDGSRVAYLAPDPASGIDDIWLLDLATGERRNLTNTPDRFENDPAWWPGRPDVLVFGSDTEAGMASSDYPTVVGLDGSGYQVLDSQAGGPRALSPDGSAIAYGGFDVPGAIYRWGTGPESFNPADYGIPADKLFQPAWSPDGGTLAWKVGGDLEGNGAYRSGLALLDLASGEGRLLHVYEVLGGGTFPDYLAWSPDGTWLAFVTFGEPPATGRAPNLWVARADGSEETYIGEGLNPVWSPDGERLAFMRTAADNTQEISLAQTGSWEVERLTLPSPAERTLFLGGWIAP